MQRSRSLPGALASVLAAVLLGLVMAFTPHAVLAADYDVEVDACSLLDDSDVEGLTAWTAFTTGFPDSSASLSS